MAGSSVGRDGEARPGRLEASAEALGESAAFLEFQEALRRVAPVERPVLLLGERGTGKEMAARRLHYLSGRWDRPFVTLNCSALSPSLIESELFGHERGAFTGARERRVGRFEAADGGTLFLDEISLIPASAQEKILRVVEYGGFERVGGSGTVEVDVRIVGASNANLREEARAGRFKPDLLDRLSFEVLFLPPLREREEDILLLARHFAARMARELGHDEAPEFGENALEQLTHYPWPGNVRELKNVVERAVYRAGGAAVEEVVCDPFRPPWRGLAETSPGGMVTTEEASGPAPERGAAGAPQPIGKGLFEGMEDITLSGALRRVEIHFLRRALELSQYNQRIAAEALGLTYHQFRGLYRKHQDVLRPEED